MGSQGRTGRGASGFTFIELLVALTVFSIVAVCVLGVFRSGLRTWREGNRWSEEDQAVRNVYRTLVKDLTGAVNYAPDTRFEGNTQELSLMTWVDRYETTSGLAHKSLARVIYRYDRELRTLTRKTAGKNEGFDPRYAKAVVIAENIDAFGFAYGFESLSEGAEVVWKSEWEGSDEVPGGVRIDMNGLHTAVWIPVGKLGKEDAFG